MLNNFGHNYFQMRSSKIVILVLLIGLGSGVAENIIISPLCGSNAPSSCVTLSQYISSNNGAAASLVLLPGVHTLTSPLRVENSEFFHLQGQGQSSQVTVDCFNSNPNFVFVNVNEIALHNLVLIQCSVDIRGSLSSTVRISYSEFSGSRIDRGFSIVQSNNVSISHSIFRNHQSESSTEILRFSQINNLKLSHCMIRDNHAYRYMSFFHEINKTEIFRCIFTNNTIIRIRSIADFRQTTSVRISYCAFENNFIGPYADVLSISGAIAGVTDTTFSHNIVDDRGHIAYINSSFGYISCSSFWNNSFFNDHTNVIRTSQNSISISNSTFTLNRQIGGRYGRIFYCYSNCTVISSVFKNNSVGYGGDIVYTNDHLISIFASEFVHNTVGEFGDLITGHNSDAIILIDCTLFLNNSFWDPLSHNNIVLRNSEACNQLLVIGERATSTCSDCEGMV